MFPSGSLSSSPNKIGESPGSLVPVCKVLECSVNWGRELLDSVNLSGLLSPVQEYDLIRAKHARNDDRIVMSSDQIWDGVS